LRLREDKVVAKGKGELITYWLEVKSTTSGSKSSFSSGSGDDAIGSRNSSMNNETTWPARHEQSSQKSKKLFMDKIDRLVDWNTDNLARSLQQIVDSRRCGIMDDDSGLVISIQANPFDEVKEIIALPQEKKTKPLINETVVQISADVLGQLRDYVSKIAHMYNDNHFHNFEHVSSKDWLILHGASSTVIFSLTFSLLRKTPGITCNNECD
jgi:hypothetical protein